VLPRFLSVTYLKGKGGREEGRKEGRKEGRINEEF
jgi:hypothetical protein